MWLFDWLFEFLKGLTFFRHYVPIRRFELFDGFDFVAVGLFEVFETLDGFDSQDQSGGTCTTDGSACGSHPLRTAAPCSCHKQNKTKQHKGQQRKGVKSNAS